MADDLPDFADEVSGRLDDVARIKALRRALAGLTRPELEVLAVCVWSGLGYAEAAEALGIPVGTVRSRLSRARDKLRAQAVAGELPRPPAEPAAHPADHVGRADRGPAARPVQEDAS